MHAAAAQVPARAIAKALPAPTRTRKRFQIVALLCAAILWAQDKPAAQRRNFSPEIRLSQIVQANVIATHAYQILLARRTGKGDPTCYAPGSMSDAELESLVQHHGKLLASDRQPIKSWTMGNPSKFDPARDLDPMLTTALRVPSSAPVNVLSAYLTERARIPASQTRAIANLYQTALEIERDGDRLQEEFDFYITLGLPVYLGQFGLSGTDRELLEAGKELAASTCASPFATDAAAWQIAGRKIWNWAEKKLHIRDERTVANEMVQQPEISSVLTSVRALAPARIAVIGHSFTMAAHWSSPSSFVGIVSTMVSRENPKIVFRQFEAGGLTAGRARQLFLSEAVDWKPDKVLLVVLARSDADYAALAEMGEAFRKIGSECIIFDSLHDPQAADAAALKRFNDTARASGMTIIGVESVLSSSPDRDQFLCLDGIHMKEPYHRLMAREWLKFLAGARGANP